MAQHSSVENAGQRYASARRRGEDAVKLRRLKGSLGDRRGAATETKLEENARKVAETNKNHQRARTWRDDW